MANPKANTMYVPEPKSPPKKELSRRKTVVVTQSGTKKVVLTDDLQGIG